MTRIAINGFGRIGRNVLRALLERDTTLEVVAVDGDRAAEAAGGGVEGEKTGQRLRLGEVVDGDDLQRGVALQEGAEHVAADATETVDLSLIHI